MLIRKSCAVNILLVLLFGWISAVHSEESVETAPVTWYILSFENDAFGVLDKSDDGYSNGIAYSWGYAPFHDFEDIDIPEWIRALSEVTYLNKGDSKKYSISYGVSQGMFTPQDLAESELIVDDRPYAGTLLWHAKLRNYGNNIADSLGLTLGIAGPAALAEQSQTLVHEIIGAQIPQGWHNQIENEPVFRVEAEHIIRFADFDIGESVEFDTSLYSQAGIGNLISDAGAGLTIRIGTLLDESYAFLNPIPSRSGNTVIGPQTGSFNWQFFASVYGRYVFNDITFDGNTFKDSHSVDLVNEQGVISVGYAISWQNWGLIFSAQRGTDQFDGQESKSNFGALSLSYHH